MTIRKAEKQDAPEILRLLAEIANFHHNGRPDLFRRDFTKYSIPQIEELISSTDVLLFVSEDNEGVNGYAIAQIMEIKNSVARYDRKYLYLDDLCVENSKRGEGTGTQLFTAVKNAAKQMGCESLELNVWEFEGNAMKFYEQNGMRPMYHHMEMKL